MLTTKSPPRVRPRRDPDSKLTEVAATNTADPDDHPPRFALIGPDRSGSFIELIAIEADDDHTIVIHEIKALPAFLALLHDPEIRYETDDFQRPRRYRRRN